MTVRSNFVEGREADAQGVNAATPARIAFARAGQKAKEVCAPAGVKALTLMLVSALVEEDGEKIKFGLLNAAAYSTVLSVQLGKAKADDIRRQAQERALAIVKAGPQAFMETLEAGEFGAPVELDCEGPDLIAAADAHAKPHGLN